MAMDRFHFIVSLLLNVESFRKMLTSTSQIGNHEIGKTCHSLTRRKVGTYINLLSRDDFLHNMRSYVHNQPFVKFPEYQSDSEVFYVTEKTGIFASLPFWEGARDETTRGSCIVTLWDITNTRNDWVTADDSWFGWWKHGKHPSWKSRAATWPDHDADQEYNYLSVAWTNNNRANFSISSGLASDNWTRFCSRQTYISTRVE